MSSRMGKQITVEIFGESHAPAIGMTLDGVPAGIRINEEKLHTFMARRAPGRDAAATARREADIPRFLCGVRDGVTTGAPITAIIENTDTRSSDYAALAVRPRPSHADYTAYVKYGGHNDLRGGGHFSGRLTAPLCAAGGIALQILAAHGITVGAHISRIAGIADTPYDAENLDAETLQCTAGKDFPTLSDAAGVAMRDAILAAKADGDSVGGAIECGATGLPAGLGEPMFDGVENRLAAALFGIPAVRGVEFGAGFSAADMRGSEHNDPFYFAGGEVRTRRNNSGGVQGGITNGMPLLLRVAFKPTPSIAKEQDTVDLATGENVKLTIAGRHDPCVAVRAVPVVEAVTALVLLDEMRAGGRL